MQPSPGQLIAGEWRPGRGARTLVVTEPATGEVYAELDTASLDDVDDAVQGANAASAPMEALTYFERAELLYRCAELIDERHDEIATTITRESGKALHAGSHDEVTESAAAAAVFGASYVSGQCCVATERVLVQRSVHDELVERIVHHGGLVRLGDPMDEATTMGPLNNETVAARTDAHVADAVARGATVLAGGGRAAGFPTDLYYELTVVDGVTRDMAIFREETFGPVVPITVFDDDDEAIALANDSHLGLQAAVFTSSLSRAYRYIENIRTGTVIVNDTVSFWETHPPFGGAAGTRSGWGRIGGRFTMLDMTDLRTAVIDVRNTRDGN